MFASFTERPVTEASRDLIRVKKAGLMRRQFTWEEPILDAVDPLAAPKRKRECLAKPEHQGSFDEKKISEYLTLSSQYGEPKASMTTQESSHGSACLIEAPRKEVRLGAAPQETPRQHEYKLRTDQSYMVQKDRLSKRQPKGNGAKVTLEKTALVMGTKRDLKQV